MTAREPIKVLKDIILGAMPKALNLQPAQVMLGYQKYKIPTEGLFIVLRYLDDTVIGETDSLSADGNTEIQDAAYNHVIQIDIMSFDDSARQNRLYLATAINSIYSKQLQGKYGVSVYRPAPLVDTSELEPTQFCNRYTTRVVVKALTENTLTADNYTIFGQPGVVLNP